MNDFQLNSVLICDDDQSFRERLSKSFESKGIQTLLAINTADALGKITEAKVDSAILDLRMPGESGLVLLKGLLAKFPDLRAVILTGYGSISTAMEAVRLGAHNYLTKPASFQSILAAISSPAGQAAIGSASLPSLEEVQNEYVNRILDQNDGNISRAARILGLHRRSLQRKLSRD